MSILIKGMEMPTEGMVITIYKLDGEFYASVHGTELCPLVSVPPHGRLIDADNLIELCEIMADKCGETGERAWRQYQTVAEDLPTIIEAEG